MIEKHGGLEDFVVDPFGFKYQVIPVHDDDDDDSDGDGEEDDDDDDEDKDGGDEVELVHQLCGPDGGFTSAGRDSLLFQVLLLNVHSFLSVVSLYRIELWDFESSLSTQQRIGKMLKPQRQLRFFRSLSTMSSQSGCLPSPRYSL